MYFKELYLENFRNYENQKVEFSEKVNLITGENAQGKTNLIEGLYIMSIGKSFRTPRDNDMIRFGSSIARVRTISVIDGDDTEVEICLIKNKKSIKIDGINIKKITDLLKNILIVVFSPDDLRIVKEEPARRRAFMDRELCQLKPVYYDDLSRYRKTLDQRNAYLRSGNSDEIMLNIWDEELAARGARIVGERARFVEKLDVISRNIHQSISDGREELRLDYESSVLGESSDDDLKENFLGLLRSCRQRDEERGNTLYGPHHDDIKIVINGTDVRKFGSQGQQRSAALSLKLAEIEFIFQETGEKPVLLLDDVLSELDRVRQKKLITSFEDVQIFITATYIDEEILADLPDRAVFSVDGGRVVRVE